MQSYMSRGEPSDELRAQILSPKLAAVFSKPGRALVELRAQLDALEIVALRRIVVLMRPGNCQ